MIPQLVGVEKLPWRSGLVINLIDERDGGCIWFIMGGAFSDCCFKHLPKNKRLLDRVRDGIDMVKESSWEIRKLMVCRGGDEAADWYSRGGGCRSSGILFCKTCYGDLMWLELNE